MPKPDLSKPIRFNWKHVTAAQFEDFEEVTGMDFMEFHDILQAGQITEKNFLKNLRPFCAFLWIALRETQPGLSFEDVRNAPLAEMIGTLTVEAEASQKMETTAPTSPPSLRHLGDPGGAAQPGFEQAVGSVVGPSTPKVRN